MTFGIQEMDGEMDGYPVSDRKRMPPLRTDHKQRMASLKLHIPARVGEGRPGALPRQHRSRAQPHRVTGTSQGVN
jgi:hypothetical protein